MISSPCVIVIHGTGSSPTGNWFPWLCAELTRRGITTRIPAFPTPTGQCWNRWREVFYDFCPEGPGAQSVLVGHSVGCAMILRLLEEVRRPVRGAFLVSGWYGLLNNRELDPLIESFCTEPFDWRTIRQNAGTVLMYHGDDDPYVPLGRAEALAHQLGAELEIVPGGKHLNTEAGFTIFPELLTALLEAIAQ